MKGSCDFYPYLNVRSNDKIQQLSNIVKRNFTDIGGKEQAVYDYDYIELEEKNVDKDIIENSIFIFSKEKKEELIKNREELELKLKDATFVEEIKQIIKDHKPIISVSSVIDE